jgi:hypothetical protein
LIYQVHLQEVFDNHPESPSKERTKICFTILDSIMQNVGAYSSVLSTIVDELRNAVYSNAVTASNAEPFYEKVPYSVLVDRINKNRIDDEKQFEFKLDDYRQKLKFRDQDLEIAYRKNLQLKQKNLQMENDQIQLKDELENLKAALGFKTLEMRDIKQERSKAEDKFQKEKELLINSLNLSKKAIEKLTVFNNSATAASETRPSQYQNIERNVKIEITAKGLLSYDIMQAHRMEKEYSQVLDCILDDFEQSIGQVHQKREIMLGVSGFESQNTLDTFAGEIEDVIETFKNKINRYLTENKLLKRHIEGLRLQLKRNESNAKLPSIDPVSDFHTRKYGFSLMVSDDGIKFELHGANDYCIKCGDRVIACPHKQVPMETFSIEKNYFRIQQPSLYLHTELDSIEMIENHLLAHTITEDETPFITTSMQKIWKEFYNNRGGVKPGSNRSFTLEKVIDMIQEWYDAKWVDEEKTATEEKLKWEAMLIESPEKEHEICILYSTFRVFSFN